MGYGNSLMYWEPILRKYISTFPETHIYTSGKKILEQPDIHVEDAIHLFKIILRKEKKPYPKYMILISPLIMYKLIKYRPKLIIVSEFGLLTIYGILSRILLPKSRILLLVESHPKVLAGGITRKPKQWIRRLICKASTHILTNNVLGKKYLTNELSVNANKITTSPYLVSSISQKSSATHDTSPYKLSHNTNDFVAFLYVGKLMQPKGIFDIIDALLHLPKEKLEQCKIWFVGDGESRDELEQMVSDNNLLKYVQFFGHQPYTQLSHFYHNADAFLFPTYCDYRALVGFEALSYGLPLIHSRGDGAISEVVIDNQNGFSFDSGDTKSISNHMAFFIDNPDKLELFGIQSKLLSETFTVDNSAKTLVNASCNAMGINQ